ncbi:acyl-CoA N-acyltransferase [Coprinellus micaceus]|uniref:Acyl-CoA N-acyltransferase n=1 Tax=Coprinellus micaceus TaxID=71717 RepID=A0A4Y7SI37_COPMI|nr:acyl-CoA N-acyltransferase [Coprinellus micaceus]
MTSATCPRGLVVFSPDFRIKLTLATPDEDEAVSKLRSIPSVRKHMPFLPTLTKDEAEITRIRRAEDPSLLDVLIFVRTPLYNSKGREDGSSYTFAGVANVMGLGDENHGEVGIIIAPEFQGKGVTTPVLYTFLKYLFEHRKLRRVMFETSTQNKPMIGWLEKAAGLRCERIREGEWKSESGPIDVRSYAITGEEWGGVRNELERKMGTKKISW